MSLSARLWDRRFLLAALFLYIALALGGIRYGLPHKGHMLSYDCDEYTWLEALSRIKPAKLNPAPELHSPTGYLWMYGAAVGVASAVGILPTGQSKEWYLAHPEMFARFFL